MNKYYAVLGLPSTASKDDVRRKYRQLVLIWHPDKNPSPEAHNKFIAITEAYDIINGERVAPRTTFSTKRRTSTTSAPPARKKTTAELFREKYLAERTKLRNSGQFEQKKVASESRILLWKIVTGVTVIGLIAPWFIAPLNIMSCIIITMASASCIMTFGFHAHNLSKQAQMMFGESTNYDYSELRDYFFRVHKLRWGRNTVVGPPKGPW